MNKVLTALLVLFSAVALHADVTTGDLRGTVISDTGEPIGGATVIVMGPALMGSKSTATREDGTYRLSLLPPGTYELTTSAPGFATQQISGISVHIGATAEIPDIQLLLPTVKEEVNVIAAHETIDTSSTAIGRNIVHEEFEKLPVGRGYQTIATLVPGVTLDTAEFDPGRLRNTPSFLGSSAPENAYYVDGMATTDGLWGLNGTQLSFDLIDEIQVLTGGYEAEYGRSTGGVINVITKSGGNEMHGSVFSYLNSYGMTSDGFCSGTRGEALACNGRKYADAGADVGGALIKDKIWYFLAYNPTFDYSKSTGFLGQELNGNTRTDQYATKITWNINPSNHLGASFFGDPNSYEGPGGFSSTNASPESYLQRDLRGSNNAVVKYTGITHADNLFFDLTVGRRNQRLGIDPLQGESTTPHDYFFWTDPLAHGDSDPQHVNGFEDGGIPYFLNYDVKRTSLDFKSTYLRGNHDIKAGFQYDHTSSDSFETYSGQLRRRLFDDRYTFDHFIGSGNGTTNNTSFFLQDSWQINQRLNVHAGFRYDQQHVKGPTAELSLGSLTDFSDGWSPRLGFTYDVTGNGQSRLFASFGRFYENMPVYIDTTIFGVFTQSVTRFNYGPDNIPFTADDGPGELLFEVDSSKTPIRIDGNLKGQFLQEFVLGYEWQLTPRYTAGVKGIFRSIHRVIEDMYTDTAYILGHPGSGLASAFPEATRNYRGLELTFGGRISNRLNFQSSYVYSRLRGNYEGLYVTTFPQVAANMSVQFDLIQFTVNGDGRLYDDRPHRFKLYGAYDLSSGTTIGSILNIQSGRPTNALGWDSNYGDSFIFTKQRGSVGRTPTTWRWDLHLEQRILRAMKLQPTVLLDIFNVTNQNEVVDVDDNRYTQEFDDAENPFTVENPFWKTATRFQSPRVFRLGIKVNW